MITLIRKQPADNLFPAMEWFSIGSLLEALIIYEQEFSSINIRYAKNKHDITSKMANILERKGYEFKITSGIDCCFITVPNNMVETILCTVETIISDVTEIEKFLG
jgi:hypothetical protein